MGRCIVPLPLYGTAHVVRTDARDNRRQVVRLCDPSAGPVAPEDAALIKSPEESRRAASSGFRKAWVVGDNCPADSMPAALEITYCVSERYDYLAAGDLIGVEAVEGRFRVHYRRSSAHNSFLVTDRCN